MASVNMLRFFFSPEDPSFEGARIAEEDLPRFVRAGRGAVLRGASLGKRSLCWAYCESWAAENHTSLILCSKKRTDNKGAPLMTFGSREAENLWTRVQIRYVETPEEATAVLLSLHLMKVLPRVIVLDHPLAWSSNRDFTDKSSVQSLGVLLGALNNALAHSKVCTALIAEGRTIPPIAETMLAHWFPLVFEVSRMGTAALLEAPQDETIPKIKYTITPNREYSLSSWA